MTQKENHSQSDEKGRRDNGKDGYDSEKAFKWYVCPGDPIGVDEPNNSSKKSYQGSHGQAVN